MNDSHEAIEFEVSFEEKVWVRTKVKAKSLAEAKRMVKDGQYDEAEPYCYGPRRNIQRYSINLDRHTNGSV